MHSREDREMGLFFLCNVLLDTEAVSTEYYRNTGELSDPPGLGKAMQTK